MNSPLSVPLPALGMLALMATAPAYAEPTALDERMNGEIAPETTPHKMIEQEATPAPAGGELTVNGQLPTQPTAPTEENYETELTPAAPLSETTGRADATLLP